VAIGIVSLGKYTLPNIAEFAVNVFDVEVKHNAKYDQIELPAK
jgi:hypothetical protein